MVSYRLIRTLIFDSHFNIKKGKNFRYGYYQSYQQDEKV